MNLARHLDLAGRNLIGCLSPERNYLPYWHMAVWPDRTAEYQFRRHCTGHNVGRWWNSMLRLEAETGFEITAPIETAMVENTIRLCDNPLRILLDEPSPDDPATWYIHSFRETMLALGLLVSRRGSDAARKLGLHAISRMREASRDLDRWDLSRCGGPPSAGTAGRGDEPCYTHGRAIEGLLCFHDATASPESLEEAERLASYHFEHDVRRDGTLAPGAGHHTHSYLNTLRGLLLLALRHDDAGQLEALRATYANAVSSMITPSGFVTHDIGDRAVGSGGDIASAGDIAHLALLLYDRYGEPAYLDDAERIVRARLAPAQVVEPMPVRPRRSGSDDAVRDLSHRFVGAIGGSVGHVRGQTCVTDFTAAALHTLIELSRRAVDVNGRTVRVNFHFDARREGVEVRCAREATKSRIDVRAGVGKELLIRIPGWALHDSVLLEVDGNSRRPVISDGFVRIPPSPASPSRVRVEFALPRWTGEEEWREPEATADKLTFTWRGDEIERVDPVGAYLEPYPKECRSL
jgi:hypothetical protein